MVGKVAFDEVDSGDVGEIVPLSGNEAVEHAHRMAAAYKLLCEVRTDEPGPAGDEI
jgi:hypothetical protein